MSEESGLIVFLGGTCNNSKWRDELIPKLNVMYFNPVVEIWDEEAQLREEEAKANAKYDLYVITPKMKGLFSIAELVDDSNKRPDSTIICMLKEYDGESFDEHTWKSVRAIEAMTRVNGAKIFHSLDDVANFLNNHDKPNYLEELYRASKRNRL